MNKHSFLIRQVYGCLPGKSIGFSKIFINAIENGAVQPCKGLVHILSWYIHVFDVSQVFIYSESLI